MATPLMTLKECADRLQVSTRTVQRLVKKHELSCTYVGGRPRFDEIDLADYLAGGRDCNHSAQDIQCLLFRAIGRWPHEETFTDLIEKCGLKPRQGGFTEEDYRRAKKYCKSLTGKFAMQRADSANRDKPQPEPQPEPEPERVNYHNSDGTVDLDGLLRDTTHTRCKTLPRDKQRELVRARLDEIEAEAARRGIQPKRKTKN